MTMRGLLPLSLLLLLLAPPAAAQDLDDGAALQEWRQYLAGVTDTSLLLERERAMLDVARERRDSTLLHLQLGFLAIRLGEVTGRRGHFDDAISEFEWAAELEPRWPWPWYGVGLAEERVGDSRISPVAGIKTMIGRDSLTRAADAMREALAREPAFAPALEELSRIALAARRRACLRSCWLAAGWSAWRDRPTPRSSPSGNTRLRVACFRSRSSSRHAPCSSSIHSPAPGPTIAVPRWTIPSPSRSIAPTSK